MSISPPATGTPTSPRLAHTPTTTPDAVRRSGITLAICGALWVPVLLGYDSGDPAGLQSRAFNLAGLVFQAGVLATLLTMSRTLAAGPRLGGRVLLRVVQTVLVVAMVSTVLTTIFPFDTAPTWVLLLDLGWPVSMLGLLVVGITVAALGRWHGALRVWPLLCGSWLLVAMATDTLVGEDSIAGMVVVGFWTAASFPVLGVLLAVRPELTGVSR